VLFSHASNSSKPWTDIVRVAHHEPLWYGKDGETVFNYQQSDWHQHFARPRSSDEQTQTSSDATPSSRGYNGFHAAKQEQSDIM